MLNLSKKTEYGLMALIYLVRLEPGGLANVSRIADSTSIPRELLAKILSELVRADLAVSFAGPTGGYRLARNPERISLSEIIGVLENRNSLLECLSENGRCLKSNGCTIRSHMAQLNVRFRKILDETMLTDFVNTTGLRDIDPVHLSPANKQEMWELNRVKSS